MEKIFRDTFLFIRKIMIASVHRMIIWFNQLIDRVILGEPW
jgi:hypothetical protein